MSPSATPAPEKKRPWWTIFEHHEKKPQAQPSPSPAPSATPARRKHRVRSEAAAQPSASPGVAPAEQPPNPAETPAPEATPAPQKKQKNGGMTSQVPFVPAGPTGNTEEPVVETKSPIEEEAEETNHFQAAKAKALQDKQVQELQAKADNATGDEVKPALRRYYRALYDKMEEIDPKVKDRIERTEAATLRRVEQEGPQ